MPGDVADISGLPPNLQRVWRRRGQIAPVEGTRARFTALEAAELMLRYEVSKAGVSPGESEDLGKLAGPLILYHALLDGDGAVEVTGPREHVEHFLAQFAEDTTLPMALAAVTEVKRFLFRADGGDFIVTDELQSLSSAESPLSGYFLDLEVAGRRLSDRAGRPLLSVELHAPQATSPKVRRLTHPSTPRP